jgi:tRNA (guanine-N7-)-methyltransferase
MSEENQNPTQARVTRTNLTRHLPKPNAYALALDNEYKEFAFNEERAPLNKGHWREKVFKCANEKALDVEIGTGAGTHFANYANKHLDRYLVGLELKYKPLIQSIRRAQVSGARNSAICRYHAFDLDLLFAENEINHMFIHFPDPWVTPRKPKNRVVNFKNLELIYDMQRAGSYLEFKTDSREYFLWSLDEIKKTRYKVEFETLNLYKDGGEYLAQNFQTTFEKIFVRQGIEINYIKLSKS